MAEINMDASRAAREAARSEPRGPLVFGGVSFDLPSEMPLDAAEALDDGNYRGFIGAFLDGRSEEFWAMKPSVDDVRGLVEALSNEYVPGADSGESEASPSSSDPDSMKSRPPSSQPTVST